MSEEKLGCAIHGAGWVSTEHLRAYNQNPHCEVVAVSSRKESSAREKAGLAGLDPDKLAIYTNYDDLMADDRVQCLSICTPNHLHVEEGVKACEAGKHFIMEKPMAITLDGVKELRDAVRESGVKTVVSFVLHWNPSFINTRALLQANAIGRLFYVEVDYWHGVSDWYSGFEWATRKDSGASVFLAAGCHAIDGARWLTGEEVKRVSGYAGGWDERYEWPATAVASVLYESGAIGKLSASYDCVMPYQFNIDIMGTEGAIRDNLLWSTKLLPEQSSWAEVPCILPDSGAVEHHPFEGEVNHFIDCVLNDEESDVNVEDAVKTHEVCLAIDMSAENNGEPVQLPLLKD